MRQSWSLKQTETVDPCADVSLISPLKSTSVEGEMERKGRRQIKDRVFKPSYFSGMDSET